MNTTQIQDITRDGQPAIKITCGCKSHLLGADSAVITGSAAVALASRKGKAQSDRIHGFVLMANHPAPMMRKASERAGVFAA